MDELDLILNVTLNGIIVVRCRVCTTALGDFPLGPAVRDPEGFRDDIAIPLARDHRPVCGPGFSNPVAGRVGGGGRRGARPTASAGAPSTSGWTCMGSPAEDW